MDGASKFVRGDAIAGIIITLINIVGGLVIGIVDAGMDIAQAASLFTRLTIGDGLVSQVPAFLISLAAGLLVTRSSSGDELARPVRHAAFFAPAGAGGHWRILGPAGVHQPAGRAAGGHRRRMHGLAVMLSRRQRAADEREPARPWPKPRSPEERVEDYLAVDPMEVEIGVGLIRLADPKRGGDLLERIQRVRQNVAAEMGLIMPKVRIRDNMRLEPNQYRIKIADIAVAEGKVYPGMLLAIDSGVTTGQDQRAGCPRAGLRHAGHVDRAIGARPGRAAGLHGRRADQRAGHASDRSGAQPCGRNSQPRRHQASDRRAEKNIARGGRRADSRPDEIGGSAADFADAVAREGAHSAVGADFGNAGRIRRAAPRTPCYWPSRCGIGWPARSAPATATKRAGCAS